MITINTKQIIAAKNYTRKKGIIWLTYKSRLALTGFRTIPPCFQQVKLTWARDLNENRHLVSGQLKKKHATLMGSKPEPAIWSRDTGQRISWYDSCQLHIICMSNINDICCNPTLHDLVLAGWPPCCATSFVVVVVVVVGRTRPWSMPLAILTKRKELHGFLFLCIRVVPFSIIMGLRLAALWAAGAPLWP